MGFTVEEGVGLGNANSYASVEFADAYFLDRGVTKWAALDNATKQVALIKATDFIENRWGQSFVGRVGTSGQALSFPRTGIRNAYGTEISGIPDQLKKATCEYALRSLTADLAPDPTVDASGLQVASRRSKLEGLEEEVTYTTSGVTGIIPGAPLPYPAADRLLAGLVRSGGYTYR